MCRGVIIASFALVGMMASPTVLAQPILNPVENTFPITNQSDNFYNNDSRQTLMSYLGRYTNFPHVASPLNINSVNTFKTTGGDLGMQVWRFFGVEGGGYYFQNGAITGSQTGSAVAPQPVQNQQVNYKSWVGYLAMKAKAPIMRMLDVYAKVGAGYEHQDAPDQSGSGSSSTPGVLANGTFHSWVPVFSVGIEDHITKSLNLNLQYMHLADNWQLDNNATPNNNKFTQKNIVTMSLGYLFKL